MKEGAAIALLVGEGQTGWSVLQEHLERHGWLCSFAESVTQCQELLRSHEFDLVLSTSPIHPSDALVASLRGLNCSLYYSLTVEDGCWWIPLLDHGRDCLGAPALHPNELARALDQLVAEHPPRHAD
jgi:hypothetical protein